MFQKIKYLINKNQYLYFFYKLIMFLLILLILDFSIGSLLNYFYFKQHSGLLYRTTFAMEKTNADLLIFGSSRANHHYNPEIFQKELALTSYNTGRDGNFIFYHYAILKSILLRYKPKNIILDFNHGEFKKENSTYERLSSLLPYYNSHKEIRSIVNMKSHFEKYKFISRIYPFNSLIFTIVNGNFKKNISKDKNGYVPVSKIWTENINTSEHEKYDIDTNKIIVYENFIKECNKNNIKLFIFVSPFYEVFKGQDTSVFIAEKIANNNQINFYNVSNNTIFLNNKNLFADKAHLNDSGATIYTNLVIEKIIKN